MIFLPYTFIVPHGLLFRAYIFPRQYSYFIPCDAPEAERIPKHQICPAELWENVYKMMCGCKPHG